MPRSRVLGVGLTLLLLTLILSSCGAAPIPQDWPGITLDGDSIYVLSGLPRQVYILNAETGVQQGMFPVPGEPNAINYWSPVTVGEGIAFVGFASEQAGTSNLYAFDPATGQQLWNVQARNLILAAPAYAAAGSDAPSGVVYFGDTAGYVYAVDVATHAVMPGWPFRAEEAIWAAPLPVGDRLYVAAMDHNLYALDATTGAQVWSTELGGALAAPPTVDEKSGILYIGAFDGRVYALRADSGEVIDEFDFQAENWIWSRPLLANDRLYVTALDGRLYELDRATGEDTILEAGLDTTEALRAGPAEAGGKILIATDTGRVMAVSNGQRLWTWPSGVPESPIYTTPVVDGDVAYVVLMSGKVQAINVDTGAPLWVFAVSESQ